jgi:hypothetical protein
MGGGHGLKSVIYVTVPGRVLRGALGVSGAVLRGGDLPAGANFVKLRASASVMRLQELRIDGTGYR